MENSEKIFESLLEKATEYGKTSFELAKLKALDKTADVVSSIIPHFVVLIIVCSFMLFLDLGLGIWLGEILCSTYYGFFAVAAFYLVLAIFIRVFLYKSLKKCFGNYFIKQVLK